MAAKENYRTLHFKGVKSVKNTSADGFRTSVDANFGDVQLEGEIYKVERNANGELLAKVFAEDVDGSETIYSIVCKSVSQ
jgi:hypothetical protein